MPRVQSQIKSNRGRERSCGRCGRTIEQGESYFKWSFRYGGTHFRCKDHPPRPSELTQSKMAEVYAAIENAEDGLPGAEGVDDIRDLINEVAEAANQVAEEYREAAEPFQGQGENAERADDLEGWAQDLEYFDADEDEDADDPLEGAREEAREKLGECPL